MTLFAETSPRVSYFGTGVTTDFVYPFRVLEDEELAVYVDGDLKGLGSHYSVTGIDTPTGGTVTFFTPPVLNALVLLMRDMPLTQPVDLREHDALSAETQEREYDRLTMLIQWQEDQHAHMLRLANLSPTILPQGSLPEPEPGKFLRWHDPTHLDNAEVVSAGSLTIGGDVAGHAAFWVAPQALGGDPGFYWDPARRGLTLARGMHEGSAPLAPHKDGPLHVFLKNSDNVNGYNGILCHVHNGAPTDTLSTLVNDKVAIGGWTKRGFGGSSPIYGGNFGVVFDTVGVANGCEIDVQNDSGVDGHGQGLWVNGSGGNHRSNAILIDTQDATKWTNGIKFTSNFGGGATGNVLFAGIVFDHNQSQNHILIVPFDDLNPSNNVLEVRDSVFDQVRAGIQKRGAFAGRASATGFNDPTFTWTDSPRSGIYSPAIEHLAISTNGFPRVHITDTGDVRVFSLAGSGTAGVSVEADGRLIRGAGGGGGGGAITSPLVVSGAAAGELRLLELPANGTDYVGFKAPDALAAPRIWTLPAIDGSNGQVLTTDGALSLSWTTPSGGGGGAVTSVGGLAGVIGTTSDVNVTMTSTAPNLVLGWTGTLSMARGGTGGGGAPPGHAAFWTASGVAGDGHLTWDNAIGAKRLNIGIANDLTSASRALNVSGRSTGGSDPVFQVLGAFAGASPTVNFPVAATFIGDFLGGASMPAGFGTSIELALHDYLGAGTFIPAAVISASAQFISPPSTSLLFGAVNAGTAFTMLTLSPLGSTFKTPVYIGTGNTGIASSDTQLSVASANGVSTSVARLESTHAGQGTARTALALVRTNLGLAMNDGFAVRQDFILRDVDAQDNVNARIIVARSGVDGTGTFALQTAVAGFLADRLTINNQGQMFYTATPTVGAFGLVANGTRTAELLFFTNNNLTAVGLVAPPTSTGSFTWKLPQTFGDAGSILTNDGSGQLTWSTTAALSLTSLVVGPVPAGGQAAGALKATVSNSDNALPYQAILGQMVNGSSAGMGPITVANDKVALVAMAWRGAGGTSPLYAGVFNATFTTPGVVNGVELGVVNNSGVNTIGNGLWLNGDGANHRDNAILIDAQTVAKWNAGIRFTEGNLGGGATGSIAQFGIVFDKSHDADFLVIRPRVGAGNSAIRITDAAFTTNHFNLTNDGRMALGAVALFGPAGSINVAGNINAFGTIGCSQYFAASLPGFTGNVSSGTLHFTGGILTSVT